MDRCASPVQRTRFFPSGGAWLDKQLDKGLEFRPRDILTWARDAWDEASEIDPSGWQHWIQGWPGMPRTGGDQGRKQS